MGYNFVVLSSGKSKLQPVNFVTLWDFVFILAFVWRALMMTLAFNDHYDRHKESLINLIDHIRLEQTLSVSNKTARDANSAQQQKESDAFSRLGGGDPVKFVETFRTAVERFDAPSSLFGMKVNRNLITGFSSTVLLFLAPQ